MATAADLSGPIGAMRTELGTLYHCKDCGLEDRDKAYIIAHIEAGCPAKKETEEWANSHHWQDGLGWISNDDQRTCRWEDGKWIVNEA